MAIFGAVWLSAFQSHAQDGGVGASESGTFEDVNEVPYFEVEGTGKASHFPMTDSHAEVEIVDGIAMVTLTQTFLNDGEKVISAKYLFPTSTRTAVHGMEMQIGNRRIRAEIQEKQEAKQTYEKAKKEGKGAALLEQHRPNVFQTRVANILPGEEVEVVLRYTEMLGAKDSVYEFVYPTAIGPRYERRGGGKNETWVANPYLSEGEIPPIGFSLDLSIRTSLPLASLHSPSHEGRVSFTSENEGSLSLSGAEHADRDLIIHFQLAGEEVQSGVLLHEDEQTGENFFLLNVQPPARVRPEHIPPREYTFVVDVSGSMNGFPIQVAKELFRDLANGLNASDRLNVLLFAGGNRVLAQKALPATASNVDRAIRFFEGENGGGGTELLPALERVFEMRYDRDYSRSIVVITDGYVSVEKEAFELVRKQRNEANVFVFGIGSSVNRYLVEGLAHVGGGEPFVVTKKKEAKDVAEELRDYLASPVLTDIKVESDGFELYDVVPGNVPDVFAQRALSVVGKWKGEPKGTLRLRGVTGEGKEYIYETDIKKAVTEGGTNHPPLKPLWAREKVRGLVDYAKHTKDAEAVLEVTNIGLGYELVTPYTSFVAVDEVIKVDPGLVEGEEVTQVLPLPKGVSNQALSSGSIPEPQSALLLLVALFSILAMRHRKA